MGRVQFGSGGIRFNVRVKVGSGVNRVRRKLSRVNFESVYILNMLISNLILYLKDKIRLIR